MTHHRIRHDRKLFFSTFSQIESRIQLPERAHSVLSEAKEFLNLAANSPIWDSPKQLSDGGVFGCLRQSTASVLLGEAKGNRRGP